MNEEFSDGLLTADIVIDAADVTTPVVQSAIEALNANLASDSFRDGPGNLHSGISGIAA